MTEGQPYDNKGPINNQIKEAFQPIVLVNVVCNTSQPTDSWRRNSFQRQVAQWITMLKSLLFFSSSSYRVILLTDTRQTFEYLVNRSSEIPARYISRLRMEYVPPWHPKDYNYYDITEWRPCSVTKMFLPNVLLKEDYVLYFDTDILFLGDPAPLWPMLLQMKSPKFMMAGPAPTYKYFGHRRYAGIAGMGAGMLGYNLREMRALPKPWHETYSWYKKNFKHNHDQDTLNDYFYDHPEHLEEVGPQWQFNTMQCMFGVLRCCTDTGVKVLHGVDATFYRDLDYVPQLIYQTFNEQLLNSTGKHLLEAIENRLDTMENSHKSSTCAEVFGLREVLLKGLRDKALQEE